jgi:hypothetical protein
VATARREQANEAAEIEAEPRTIPPEMDPGLSEVTRPSDLGFGKAREIEVEPLRELPPEVSDDGMMEIRMAETIEEFTYGNPHVMVRLEQGKRYRVPVHIGQYLIGIGKVYLR